MAPNWVRAVDLRGGDQIGDRDKWNEVRDWHIKLGISMSKKVESVASVNGIGLQVYKPQPLDSSIGCLNLLPRPVAARSDAGSRNLKYSR